MQEAIHVLKSLVSGSEELEKLAGAAVGGLVLLPAFPCFGCLGFAQPRKLLAFTLK